MKIQKHFKIFCFIFVLLAAISCKKDAYTPNETFDLKYHHKTWIALDGNKYKVEFTKIVDESRCPPDAMCFNAGYVVVELEIKNEKVIQLGLLSNNVPSSIEFKGHIIHLLEVKYNNDRNFGKPSHSSVKLKID